MKKDIPLDADLLSRLARPVPRYTSYPTSPHFHDGVGAETYARWLEELPAASDLSLYAHIPYCDTLCWFCACTTKITRQYAPVSSYLDAVYREIAQVGKHVKPGNQVTHIHWGGGSPDILSPEDIGKLAQMFRSHFTVSRDAEFAVEIDPRAMNGAKTDALVNAGVTRISLGVQDFAPEVQDAINRHQPLDMTRDVINGFRAAGVTSVNIDLVYGLPYQTTESAQSTVDAVLGLEPDRVAIFGYAHLPQRVAHQRLIPDEALPDVQERLELARIMSQSLQGAGYLSVGIDHFCKPEDSMAHVPVRRNFQGYTTDTADALLGFGASSISRLPMGYAQNTTSIPEYKRHVENGSLAVAKGIELTREDRARAFAIETLLCEMRFPGRELRSEYGAEGAAVADTGKRLVELEKAGLIATSDGGFHVTEEGRPFLRAVASEFDAYFGGSAAVHSSGV